MIKSIFNEKVWKVSLCLNNEYITQTLIKNMTNKRHLIFSLFSQSTLNGNMAWIVVFGGPKSGKYFMTSDYDPNSEETQGIFLRVIAKLLDSKKCFEKKGIRVTRISLLYFHWTMVSSKEISSHQDVIFWKLQRNPANLPFYNFNLTYFFQDIRYYFLVKPNKLFAYI